MKITHSQQGQYAKNCAIWSIRMFSGAATTNSLQIRHTPMDITGSMAFNPWLRSFRLLIAAFHGTTLVRTTASAGHNSPFQKCPAKLLIWRFQGTLLIYYCLCEMCDVGSTSGSSTRARIRRTTYQTCLPMNERRLIKHSTVPCGGPKLFICTAHSARYVLPPASNLCKSEP